MSDVLELSQEEKEKVELLKMIHSLRYEWNDYIPRQETPGGYYKANKDWPTAVLSASRLAVDVGLVKDEGTVKAIDRFSERVRSEALQQHARTTAKEIELGNSVLDKILKETEGDKTNPQE